MSALAIGESASLKVPADAHCFNTGIGLIAGGSYLVMATGRWWDWFVNSGPQGYSLPVLGDGRRVASAPMFCLIGCVDGDEAAAFAIGRRWEGTPATTGVLCCFANDLPKMYWNNWGSVGVTVTRQS